MKQRVSLEKIYHVGQKLALDMMPSEKGKYPISRTKEGAICIIDLSSRGDYPVGSTWDCKIVQVHVNKLIIKPVIMLESAASNEYMLSQKLKKLTTEKTGHKEKVKVSYPYQTKVEQLKGKAV
jgi:hypothetical protein